MKFPLIHRVATRRMIVFGLITALVTALTGHDLDWRLGLLIGFDAGSLVYVISCFRLLSTRDTTKIRAQAVADDDHRWVLLGVAGLVTCVILAAVTSELMGGSLPAVEKFPLIIGTIMLAWMFGNMVFALHYAHLHYGEDQDCDLKGLRFPGTPEPDYGDFVYFSFTLGLAFATSDVNIESQNIRRVVIFHSMLAFLFNIGVIGFTINLLAGLHS